LGRKGDKRDDAVLGAGFYFVAEQVPAVNGQFAVAVGSCEWAVGQLAVGSWSGQLGSWQYAVAVGDGTGLT